jgi:pimeloyl-ACP methyl ester carboxylesterase
VTPIFFLLGRRDLNPPSTLAARYLAALDAPDKGVVWFERSAHFPFLEEPERFRRALADINRRVRAAPEPPTHLTVVRAPERN